MRYLHKPGFSFLLCLFFTGISGIARAQEADPYSWQLGLGIGYTNYFGDISNYRITRFNDIGNLTKFVSFNKNYQHQPSYSLMFTKRLTPTTGFMFQVNQMQFEMSDRYITRGGTLDTAALHFARSLNFRTTLQDAGIALTFNANNGRFFSKTAFFYPSFWLGAGVSTFTVKGDLYDANGNPYNYRLPGNINDANYETNLRDLRTESADRYSNVVPYVNLGIGLNFRFSDQISLALHSDIKYSGSDYLDDVSGKYKTTYATPQEAYAARPGYNVVNPLTLQRGDDNGMNDFYINNRVVLNISLGGKKNKQQAFRSPVIYSLFPPVNYQKKLTDSLAASDSLARLKKAAMVAAAKDSTARMSSVANDTAVRQQLQSIRSELTVIRNMLAAQQPKPRLQQLQSQLDSVRTLRTRLAQRPSGREDQLRLRIYDLQSDSIRNEMAKVQAGAAQYPAIADSSVSLQLAQLSNRSAGLNGSIPAQNITEEVQADSISEAELKSFNTDISKLKKDKRYKADADFRANVDSLQRKVNAYPVKPKNSRSTKAQVQQVQPVQVNNDSGADQARMDSLQRRLAELENRVSNNGALPAATDTVLTSRNITDTAIYDRNLSELRTRLQRNTDSLAQLQRQLKRSNDSAEYFRRAAFAAANPVSSTPEKKWYQKIFRSKKTKEQDEADTYDRQLQLQREADSVAYYRNGGAIPNNYNTYTETPAPQKKWYQKIFGSGKRRQQNADGDITAEQQLTKEQQALRRQNADLQRRLKRAEDSAAYYRKNGSAPPGNNPNTEAAPKKKWYQKIFGSGKRKQQNTTVAVNTTTDQKALQQKNNELQRHLKQAEDSAAFYRKSLAASSAPGQQAAAPKRKWYQKIFGSGKRTQQNTGDAATAAQQAAQQQQINMMQQQLRRTEDSIAYYRKALAVPPAAAQQPATEAPKRKWYQKIFGSGKSKKKQTDEQSVTYAYDNQQQTVDQQQQYYNDQISRMQQSIDDLTRRNKQIADDYARQQDERNRIIRSSLASPPVVLADRSYDNYRTSSSRNNNDILALRSELDRLRSQVDDNTRRNSINNRYAPGIAVVPPVVTGIQQPVVTGVQPAVPVQTTVIATDTAHINTLRAEIDQLRNELNAIRNTPATPDTVRTAPKFDVNSFPVISVYFNTGAVTLNSDQLNRLDPFAQVAVKNNDAGIVLKGFSDPVGNAAANEALARKRTGYVKNLLVNHYRIDESRISIDEPAVAGGGRVKKPNPLDRRVDLQFR